MSLSQTNRIVPPRPEDKDLSSYSAILQRKFDALFGAAHTHTGVIRPSQSTPPEPSDFDDEDQVQVHNDTIDRLYVKHDGVWYYVNLTAV